MLINIFIFVKLSHIYYLLKRYTYMMKNKINPSVVLCIASLNQPISTQSFKPILSKLRVPM